MMIHIPGKTDKGIALEALSEFVDLFPTLVEAAGLPSLDLCPENSANITICREGSSLMPMIENQSLKWKTGVFSQYPREGSHMGYSMRTDRSFHIAIRFLSCKPSLLSVFYLGIVIQNGCCSNMLLSTSQTGATSMPLNFMITKSIRSVTLSVRLLACCPASLSLSVCLYVLCSHVHLSLCASAYVCVPLSLCLLTRLSVTQCFSLQQSETVLQGT